MPSKVGQASSGYSASTLPSSVETAIRIGSFSGPPPVSKMVTASFQPAEKSVSSAKTMARTWAGTVTVHAWRSIPDLPAFFLFFPALIVGSNSTPRISVFEIIGLAVWVAAFAMESIADLQKLAFLREMKKRGQKNQVCNVGLWRYSRHPNYFAEWMVWTALVVASVPSWVALRSAEPFLLWLLLGAGLLFVSRAMYTTLVYYTGAVPSEHYSVQKRPEYEAYQQETNRFFPGPTHGDTRGT